MSQKVYEMITDRMIEELEKGTVPWRQPFTDGVWAVNWKTQKPYRGINQFLLPPGEYATFKAIKEAGGLVKKGERSRIAVLWKWFENKDEKTNETDIIPYLRYYNVFEINTQVEGLKSRRKEKVTAHDHDPIEAAEEIVKGYLNAPPILHRTGEACYLPGSDRVKVPPIKDFDSAESYYSVLLHELVHSTGHQSRLSRPGVVSFDRFGSEQYSKEELVAEMGAAMLCGVAGIEQATIENSAAYIASWLKKLKDDKKMIIQAAQQAQKAVDLIYPAGRSEALAEQKENNAEMLVN